MRSTNLIITRFDLTHNPNWRDLAQRWQGVGWALNPGGFWLHTWAPTGGLIGFVCLASDDSIGHQCGAHQMDCSGHLAMGNLLSDSPLWAHRRSCCRWPLSMWATHWMDMCMSLLFSFYYLQKCPYLLEEVAPRGPSPFGLVRSPNCYWVPKNRWLGLELTWVADRSFL